MWVWAWVWAYLGREGESRQSRHKHPKNRLEVFCKLLGVFKFAGGGRWRTHERRPVYLPYLSDTTSRGLEAEAAAVTARIRLEGEARHAVEGGPVYRLERRVRRRRSYSGRMHTRTMPTPCPRHAHAMPTPCTRHAHTRHAHAMHTPYAYLEDGQQHARRGGHAAGRRLVIEEGGVEAARHPARPALGLGLGFGLGLGL